MTVTDTLAGNRDNRIIQRMNRLLYLRFPIQIFAFRRAVGYWPDAALPHRASEKMLWRKIFDHNPRFVTFTDKLAVRAYISERCPDLAMPALLWSGTDPAEIPSEVAARPAVIKARHGWNQNLFHTPGAQIDAARLRRWVDTVHGRSRLEWAYAHVPRRLLVEEMIRADDGSPPLDISVHAFDGVATVVEVIAGNTTGNGSKGYFRPDGRRWLEIERRRPVRPPLPHDFTLPDAMPAILGHVQRLGSGVDYARFDFLWASPHVYAGEITVYPGSGLGSESDFAAYNAVIASAWDIRRSWFLAVPQRGVLAAYADALRSALDARAHK